MLDTRRASVLDCWHMGKANSHRYMARVPTAHVGVDAVQWRGDNLDEVIGFAVSLGCDVGVPSEDDKSIIVYGRSNHMVQALSGSWLVSTGSAAPPIRVVSAEMFADLYVRYDDGDPGAPPLVPSEASIRAIRAALRLVPPGGASGDAPAWVVNLHRAACEVAGIEVRERAPAAEVDEQAITQRRDDAARVAAVSSDDWPLGQEVASSTAVGGYPVADVVVVEACARVANDAYAAGAVDMPPWDDAPSSQKDDVRENVRAVLAGESPAQTHERWCARKASAGWTYGELIDEENKTHPHMRPYEELSPAQHFGDQLFVVVVRAVRRLVDDLRTAWSPAYLVKVKGAVDAGQLEAFKSAWARGREAGRPTPIFVDQSVEVVTQRDERQRAVADWAARCFGPVEAADLAQRSLRVLEEALELAQACGVRVRLVRELASYVYGRPVGEVAQEVGGLSVTLLALAAAAGLSADDAENREVQRIVSMPPDHFAGRNALKNAAGLRAVGSRPDEPTQELSRATLVELFEQHCECRPVNTARLSHSHDCDTAITDDVRVVIHRLVEIGPDEDIYEEHRPATEDEVSAAEIRLSKVLRAGGEVRS